MNLKYLVNIIQVIGCRKQISIFLLKIKLTEKCYLPWKWPSQQKVLSFACFVIAVGFSLTQMASFIRKSSSKKDWGIISIPIAFTVTFGYLLPLLLSGLADRRFMPLPAISWLIESSHCAPWMFQEIDNFTSR